jgi:threonine dehydratase
MPLFTLDELEGATTIVRRFVPPTPAYAWPLLAEALGAEVIVKHENHTPTGAFKARGGLVYVDALLRAGPRPAGLVTATRGNHGQSIAAAAARNRLPVVIVVPHGNSPEKNAAMAAFGGEVVTGGKDFDESRGIAAEFQKTRGYHFVLSFHRDLVRGVATYAQELFASASPLDAVFVPIGMGSGICGLITVRDLLGLKTEIIGVVAENAPAFLYYTTTHNLAEGAGATPLAALIRERQRYAGKRVALILTGGNIDMPVLAKVLRGETPRAG